MFYGQWDITLDHKDRIYVPSQFREALGEKVIIFQNEKSILVYPGKEVKQFSAEQMGQLWLVSVDKKGRILIPKKVVQSSFSESKKLTWVKRLIPKIIQSFFSRSRKMAWIGWKDYFKLTNDST